MATYADPEKAQIMRRANKVLTNYFSKEMALKNAIADRLNFSIKNGMERSACVALACGHLPVTGIAAKDGNYYIHHHDTSRLTKLGFPGIDAIMDDATPAEGDGFVVKNLSGEEEGKIKVMATDSSQSLEAVKSYLSRSWRWIKSITINTNDAGLFESGVLSFGSYSPFHRETPRDVNISRYFSVNQYQTGKIVIDYAQGEVQWNDDLLFFLSGIPGASVSRDGEGNSLITPATVNIIIEFYNE